MITVSRKLCRSLVLLIFFVFPFVSLQPLPAQRLWNGKPGLAAGQAAADRHYAEKSFALALPEYQALLARLPARAPSRAQMEYRVAVALGKTQQWDAAFSAWDRFLGAYGGMPLWSARGHYQRALLREQSPHEGYQVGARIYRGSDYPHTEDTETPETVDLSEADDKAALKDFEAAVTATQAMPPRAEATDLYFDLAKFLPRAQGWGSQSDWKTARKTDWTIRPGEPYNPQWPQPKKVLYLLARIPRLAPADRHNHVLADLARGLFAAQEHAGWARTEFITPPGKAGRWRIVQTLPYFQINPITVLTQAANAAPNDPQAPQMRLMVAQWTQQAGDFSGALTLYHRLIARYPSGKWAGDAGQAAQEIARPYVSLSAPGPQPADQSARLSVASRNLKLLTLRAYQVPLEQVLLAPDKLRNPLNRFTRFDLNFGSARAAHRLGAQVAQWTYATGDKDDHQPHGETIRLPFVRPGAYLIEAGGQGGRVRAATVVLISSLALIKKTDKNRILCFAADARSGRPMPGASVIVRQIYEDDSRSASLLAVHVSRAVTDTQGMASLPLVKGQSNVQTEAFAFAPGRRYALTTTGDWYSSDSGDTRDEVKVYAYTDRPVYRPRQTVYFRELLARRTTGGSDFAPLTKAAVRVTISSPRGDTIYDQTLKSSAFGSVYGSFVLPEGAALGEYTMSVRLQNGVVAADGGSRFRVEEYKRPEYDVKVTPSTTQARFGDNVTATVQATYYSGPPVAGAKVSYKIFRSPYEPSYRFPQPYDWYYHTDDGDNPNPDADQGELVTKGTGVTDAHGALLVTVLAAKGTRGYDGDYAYTVKADVVDASRRQISGEGVLHVTNQAFYAYLNIPNGFYGRGDKVQVELRTQDADAQPVSVSGRLSVFRLTYAGAKEVATVVSAQNLTTDADGKAFTTWQSEKSGQYRITFQARDKFEQKVVAQAPVWIEGEDLNTRRFHVGGITLLTDKTTYEQGETAHVLIVSNKPNNWILLTSETGNQILTHTLVHVLGRAKTLDIPIVRAHIPNFALAAVAVRDYHFYRWQQELFVPPSRQFLHVAVSGDKPEYKPGQTGTFHVATTDYRGRPVSSEVSLAVVDSSVFYIQPEYAPDIRLFYYGRRRSLNIAPDASDAAQLPGVMESDLPFQNYQPHGIQLPDVGQLSEGLPYSESGPFVYDRVHKKIVLLDDPDSVGEQVLFSDGIVSAGGRQIVYFARSAGISVNSTYDVSGNAEFRPMGGATLHAAKPHVVMLASTPAAVPPAVADLPPPAKPKPEMPLPGGPPYAPSQVRRNFAETAFWTPAVVTDQANGTATLTVHFPDTLTTWKATARGLTAGVLVGAGDTQAVTNKHLLVRLEAPRFFVERDQVTLSAIVRNDLATDKQVRITLATNGDVLKVPGTGSAGLPGESPSGAGDSGVAERLSPNSPAFQGRVPLPGETMIIIPAHSQKRVDWTANVVGDGQATVKMTAETDEESDAVEQSFPALTYGVQKLLTQSAVMQSADTHAQMTVTIPKEHKPGSSALLVQINPSLAATTLDALPYLADYPYGCVEQTLSRFLPSVVVAKTLKDAGVDLDTLHKRAMAMQERRQAGTPFGQAKPTDASTDQTGYTYPSGTPGVMKTPLLAEGLWHTDRWHNPVFQPEELKSMTDEGLTRLVGMQRSDGGWGWWAGSAEADPYMSAYVVYGLATAKQAGIAVPPDVLARGYAYLAHDVKDRDDERDLAVWECFALSQNPAAFPLSPRHVIHVAYSQRDRLSAYGQALLALTLHNLGENENAAVVCRNLQNTATIDRENGTASWKPRDNYWWRWYNDDVETDAWAMKAYVAVLPHDDLTPMLVKWLVQNQRGSIWRSTKETAMAVYALTDYIKESNELAPDYTVTVSLGDKLRRSYTINRDNALLFDNQFVVPDALLSDGPQTVSITKAGAGRLYYSSSLQYFTTEEKIGASGTELKIQRRYFKLTPKTKAVADYLGGTFNVLDYTRTALPDGATLKSGDLIDVELVLDSKNEYDYCVFEDMKPAGCEALDLRSGGRYGDALCSDMELRDTKTAFFVDHLPQGTRVLRYRLRAEVPGAFHALPTNGYAMYAPDVRALSDSWHVTVGDEVAAQP